MKYFTTVLIVVTSLLHGTGAWMMSGRTHPELKWHTIETDHFDVHYHEGIRDIAVQGASIAEQVRPILMEQMGLDTLRRLDIVFTTEDEVLNGFAMPSNHTVIWVDQNDAALWSGDEKWMRTVLANIPAKSIIPKSNTEPITILASFVPIILENVTAILGRPLMTPR